MISKILVPTDGSRAARKAAMYTVDLARQLRTTIIALISIDKRSFTGQTVPARETSRQVTPFDLTPQIARPAYELYERQGRREGHAVQDWLQAERKIRKDESPNELARTARRAFAKE
jgi:nucleotide-binding universal stress UspA family protein